MSSLLSFPFTLCVANSQNRGKYVLEKSFKESLPLPLTIIFIISESVDYFQIQMSDNGEKFPSCSQKLLFFYFVHNPKILFIHIYIKGWNNPGNIHIYVISINCLSTNCQVNKKKSEHNKHNWEMSGSHFFTPLYNVHYTHILISHKITQYVSSY